MIMVGNLRLLAIAAAILASIAAGWTVSVSARWLQPNSANSEQAAITENMIFFTLLSL